MLEIHFSFAEGADETLGIPFRGSAGAAGWDVRANFKVAERSSGVFIEPGDIQAIPTGLSLEIPMGFECQVRSRSGLCRDHGVFVLNSPGTIDSDFRGELMMIIANFGGEQFMISHGDRIAQFVFTAIPEVAFVPSAQLGKTDRGTGGGGSTGLS